MKARSLRALLLASSLILSVGTTAMPNGGGHSTRHIGFWNQYRCR